MLIPTTQNVRTITDIRESTLDVIKQVNKLGTVYIFQHSQPKAVMVSMEEYTRLQEIMEDYRDEAEAKVLATEERGDGISLSKIRQKYT